jgi:predicted nuclease of predicted toxin-antitoxin system
LNPARFLIDAQLPPRLARVLTEMGHPSDHLEDVGLRHAKDPAIWDYSLLNNTAIITKDDDFVERFRRQSGGPPIVWLRIGNASNRALLAWFLPAVPAVVKRLEAGDRFIEVR